MIFATVPNTSSSNSKEAILNIEKEQARDYYLIQIYHCSTAKQIENIDLYLKNTFLPYLHKNGIEKVGVFAPLNNDTASDKKLYIWVPFKNIQKLDKSKPVVLYCKGGGRSAKCAKKLKDAGFEKIYDLEGGLSKWEHSKILNIEKKS